MKIPFAFVLFLISIFTFAQNPQNQNRPTVNVKGKVIEKDSKQPLEYATLILTSKKGQVTGGITDNQGNFDFNVFAGTYTVSIEFLSFKTLNLGEKSIMQNMDLGTIEMEPEAQALDEVEIIAEKSTVEVKLDKKIYNVGQDMTVKGGNATNVLENVPSVTVDVDGTVSLRGNESVRILIDGKPSGLVGLSTTDALRQLPAEAIQKVEVITSPSARYDAEGTAGIINIVLRKGKVTGFNASFNLNAGIPENYGASANLNYRAKKYNLFSNIGYNYRNAPGEAMFYNYINDDENQKTAQENRDFERLRKSFNGNIGMDYYLTDKATLTGGILYRVGPSETGVQVNSYKYNPDQSLESHTFRSEDQTEDDNLIEYSLNFTQNFKKDDHKWTVDVKYQDNAEDNNSFINGANNIPIEKNITNDSQKEWLLKTDYVLPLGDKKQFEAGFQANLDQLSTDYRVLEWNDGDYELNTSLSNIFDYKQNIYAAYVQYGTKFNKFSALLGLRSETTDLSVKVLGYDLDSQKNYTDLFPTVNLSYEIAENENLTLGYNRRIRRPHSHMINPFPSRSSTTNIFQGNPEIEPVISDAYDLGYLKKWEKVTLNTSIYYNHTNNAFQMIRENTGELNEDGIPVIVAHPINLNTEDRIGTELSMGYNPIKALQLNNSFNFFHFKSEGSYNGVDYTGNNYSWFDRFSAKVKLSPKSDFQAIFFYMGPYEDNQNKRNAMYSANAAYSIDVMKNNATLSFNISDIFNSRYRSMYTYYTDFSSYGKNQWMKRQFNVSFTYRFNQKKRPERLREDNNGGGEDIL